MRGFIMISISALLAMAAAAPPPPPGESPVSLSGWSTAASRTIEEATAEHVKIVRRLAEHVDGSLRQELEQAGSEAAMAREIAARALRGPSENDLRAAREAVRDAFRRSQVSIGRLASSLPRGKGSQARESLARLQNQQSRALDAFDRALAER